MILGQEIIIDACILGYYDKPAGETQFKLNSDDNDHTIIGSNRELISSNELKGINVTGPKVSNAKNITITSLQTVLVVTLSMIY